MSTAQPKPENMLPILIVLGIMFLGICIALNLFSRARFKKRTNAFAVTGRGTPIPRRTGASLREPGTGYGVSPTPAKCPSPASLRHHSTISIRPPTASSRASSIRPESSLLPIQDL